MSPREQQRLERRIQREAYRDLVERTQTRPIPVIQLNALVDLSVRLKED